MNKLFEFNENLDTLPPFHISRSSTKTSTFEVPDIDSEINRKDNPHHWIQQDILQITHFQYNFFQNLTQI